MIKRFFSIAIIIFMLSTFSPASAKKTTENTNITFKDITITVDEQPIISDTEPFLYQGRTYIPARALAEYMGGYVEWDDASNTVIVTNMLKYHLQVLSSGIYYSQKCVYLGGLILNNINELTISRNETLNPSSNSTELINEYQSRITDTIQYTQNMKDDVLMQMYLELSSIGIGANYEDLQYALSCYENSLKNVQLAYDCLEQYSNHNIAALEGYAVYQNKAYEYLNEGQQIFADYSTSFHNAIWE